MRYKILQIQDLENTLYVFMDYEFAEQHNFTIDDYETVYEGEVKADDLPLDTVLELIFRKFNLNPPLDYQARSLSVSDIVVLDDDKLFYCDDFGWKKLHLEDVGRA